MNCLHLHRRKISSTKGKRNLHAKPIEIRVRDNIQRESIFLRKKINQPNPNGLGNCLNVKLIVKTKLRKGYVNRYYWVITFCLRTHK